MTTGRINQVAFLHGAGRRAHVATPTEGSGSGTGAGTAVVLSRDESSSRAETGGIEIPPPAQRSASESATDGPCTWAAAIGVARDTGDGTWSAPHPRGGEGRDGTRA